MNSRPSTLLRLALLAALGPACTVGGAIVGLSDVSSSDAGSSDVGSSDAGSSDVGSPDAGSSDAGSSDAGSSDAGSSDGGSSDVGSDVVDVAAPEDVVDAAVVDVTVDAGEDVPADVGFDVPVDMPTDVGFDVPVDVPVDRPVDAPADVPVDVPADVPAASACPAGSTTFTGQCYQAFTTIPTSTAPFNYWNFAENECRTRFRGGHLVSINSAAENTFVRGLVPTTQGIMFGFSDASRAANDFAWFDGSSVGYTNWNPGQPDNRTVLRFTSSLTEDFGLMLPDGAWYDVPYADGNPYVCKFPPLSCPAGSTAFMGRCYQAFTTIPTSTSPYNYWSFAETDCASRFTGGHLVSIQSAAENTFVRSLVPTTQSIMIGFSDASRAANNFAWFDASSVGYTNWNPGQPDNRTVLRFTSSLTEDFGLMLPDGAWYDVPYADGNPYVCKF